MTKANKQPVSSTVQFDKTDPLWNETPKIGVEGLIGTVEDEEELMQKLVELNNYNKKMKKGVPSEL